MGEGSESASRSDVRRDLERILALMVDAPEAVRVRAHDRGPTTTFRVWVDDDDLGKLIGRQGRTARALRALLEARGSRDGRRYELEICD